MTKKMKNRIAFVLALGLALFLCSPLIAIMLGVAKFVVEQSQ